MRRERASMLHSDILVFAALTFQPLQQLFSIVATASLTFSTGATLGGAQDATWQSQAFAIGDSDHRSLDLRLTGLSF